MRPKNKYEGKVWDMVNRKGLMPFHNGYPDIIVEIEEYHIVACIEVKASEKDELSRGQREMMKLFHKYGFECYRWMPSSGLIPLFPEDNNVLPQLLKDEQSFSISRLAESPLLDWIDNPVI